MASLEQVLASVPGLAGYQAQVNQNNATTLGNLQQGQAVGSILAQIQKQAADRQAMQRDAQYRQQLAGATTDEERAMIAMQAEGPKGVLQHLDRKTQQQATKEATLARLQQQAQQFEQGYQIRLKQAVTAEERAALDASYKQARLALDTAAQRMTGERLFYDTGMRVETPAAPALTPTAPAQMVQGQAPNEAAAVAAINAGGGRPMTLEIPAVSPPSAPVALPSAAPEPVQVQPLAAPPNNMDARDLRLQQGAQSLAQIAQQAAPAPAATPGPSAPATQMPNFTGSPREVARSRNEWMMDQAKAASKAATKNGPIGVNVAGGRESVFINRVVNSGNQAAADLDNVVKLPISASRGIIGGRSQGKSMLDAGMESLANTMTTQEVQTYNVFATGFQRALAAIEGAGLAPSNALMHQMDAVIFKEGDTNFTKLAKLAQTRQIVEKGLETITANSRVDPETKKLVSSIIEKVQKAVPFTGAELIELQRLQAVNPNTSLRDVMAAEKKNSGGWSIRPK